MKRFSIAMIILGVTVFGGGASAAPKEPSAHEKEMGVEAKRHMKHFREEIVPAEMKRFKEYCGFEVAVDVDWDSFGNDGDRIRGLSSNRGLAELNEAFKLVCKDQVGRDGVRAKIKRLSFRNIFDRANKRMVLETGVFKIDCAYDLKALTEGTHPSHAYRSYLEKQL